MPRRKLPKIYLYLAEADKAQMMARLQEEARQASTYLERQIERMVAGEIPPPPYFPLLEKQDQRVTVYLTEDLYARFQDYCAELPPKPNGKPRRASDVLRAYILTEILDVPPPDPSEARARRKNR